MLSSGGGPRSSLLQLPKFMIQKLLCKSEIPQSWLPISLNNGMMQKMQMSPRSQCLCRISQRVAKWHDLGFGNFSDGWTTRSWRAFKSHCLWNQHLFRKRHHLTHYQQGGYFHTSSEPMPAQPAMKFKKYLLIWTWRNCSFVEPHQVWFQPSVGAGNRERQHSVQQAEKICAPERLHGVLCCPYFQRVACAVETNAKWTNTDNR